MVIYTMEYYSAIKKEWNFAICSNIDGLGGHYAKWNKSDGERQILYNITHMYNLKKYNKLVNITKKKQTHRYRKQTSSYQWEERRGEGQNRHSVGKLQNTEVKQSILKREIIESKIRYKWMYIAKQKQTHGHRKQIYGYQRGEGGGGTN